MPTLFPHRAVLVAPAAGARALAAWLNANVAPGSVPATLGPALSPSGGGAATHRWCNGAWTSEGLRAIVLRLCDLGGVNPPPQAANDNAWRGWARASKRAWVSSNRANLLSGSGVYFLLADNAGAWDDPAAAIAALGLQPTGGV